MASVLILTRGIEESWNAFLRRVRSSQGEVIVVLSLVDNTFLLQEDERKQFLEECAKIRYRLRLASKEPAVIRDAKALHIQVYDRTRKLRRALIGHEKQAETLRFFSPSLWRQQWRSRLQVVGLLSLPRVRVWVFLGVTTVLFLFVVLRLLPSAKVRVWARSSLLTHTMNVTLADPEAVSGSLIPVHVRTQPLIPVKVKVHRSLTFDDISQEFTGTDATASFVIKNGTAADVSLRAGSRLLNQAGMVFRLQAGVSIPAKGSASAKATADHLDIYNKVIGDRGNVPENLQWEFPALSEESRKLITATNPKPATGGKTSYRTVLRKEDLDLAEKLLKQDLLATAKQLLEEEREARNAAGADLQYLFKDDVIRGSFSGFVLPLQFIGHPVTSVPIEGTIIYTVPAYDLKALLSEFRDEIYSHVGEGKQLAEGSITVDPQKVIVIEYDDNLAWIKITVDITGKEQFVLDPFTPSGAQFGTRVRDAIGGLEVSDALRIIRNFPEVDKATISLWPPWASVVPSIPSSISIVPEL